MIGSDNFEILMLVDSDSYVNLPLLWKRVFQEGLFKTRTFKAKKNVLATFWNPQRAMKIVENGKEMSDSKK